MIYPSAEEKRHAFARARTHDTLLRRKAERVLNPLMAKRRDEDDAEVFVERELRTVAYPVEYELQLHKVLKKMEAKALVVANTPE